MSPRLRLVTLLTVAAMALVVIAASWGWWPFDRGVEHTEDAYIRGDVTAIAPKVAGYVAEVLVGDFQTVKAGQVLVHLESEDYRATLARARAQVAAAEAALANNRVLQSVQRSQIDAAQARVASATALAQRARTEHQRALALIESGAVSASVRDLASADSSSTGAGVAEAEANLAVARQQVRALSTAFQQLQAQADAARADERAAELSVSYTEIRAPVDGVTSERQVRVGQYVRAGTLLLSLVPRQPFWVVANFKERQLARMAVGDPAEVTIDAIPGHRLEARIQGFAPASGSEFALVPPDNATGNFTKIAHRFGVRIVFRSADAAILDALRPGMSVEVSVSSTHTYSMPSLLTAAP
jgi:membrane fusion protein (multidrug efflux system)